jgi:hypothetical protein
VGLERFYSPGEHPSDDPYLAVGIVHVGDDQLHVAVVYQPTPGGDGTLLELRAHRDLHCSEYRPGQAYGLAVFWPNGEVIPPERLPSVAATCRRIYKKHKQGGLPYSYAVKSSINRHGDFIHGDRNAPGFTCATFVLAVFDAAGFQVLEDDWPIRELDVEHHKHLLSELDFEPDAEHERALEELIGQVPRYRPSEVAAGALQDQHPAEATAVEEDAQFIQDLLT